VNLGRLFNHDQAIRIRDERRQGVEQCCFARPGPAAARPVRWEIWTPWPASEIVYCAFNRSRRPHKSAAARAVNSSLVARKILVRKTLQQRPPALVTRQCRAERADALRGADRNQPRLSGERECAFVAGRINFTDGGER
jgi:hypothetical protein